MVNLSMLCFFCHEGGYMLLDKVRHSYWEAGLWFSCSLVFGDVWRIILKYNQSELFIRCNHDLVHSWADFDEGYLLIFVQSFDCHLSFVRKLRNEWTSVNSFLLWHRRLDSHSFFVHNDHAKHTHMGVDSIQRFFYLLRWSHNSQI